MRAIVIHENAHVLPAAYCLCLFTPRQPHKPHIASFLLIARYACYSCYAIITIWSGVQVRSNSRSVCWLVYRSYITLVECRISSLQYYTILANKTYYKNNFDKNVVTQRVGFFKLWNKCCVIDSSSVLALSESTKLERNIDFSQQKS